MAAATRDYDPDDGNEITALSTPSKPKETHNESALLEIPMTHCKKNNPSHASNLRWILKRLEIDPKSIQPKYSEMKKTISPGKKCEGCKAAGRKGKS